MKKIIKQTSKSFITTLAILSGVGLAIAAWSTDTSWTSSNFDEGESITQNMLLAQTFGYTCNDSSCTDKIYWKQFDTTTRTQHEAVDFCKTKGMTLPSSITRDNMYHKNYKGIDVDGGVKGWQSMSYASTRHWANDTAAQNSTSYRYGLQYYPQYPSYNSRSSSNYGNWTQSYSGYQTLCVYKN